MKVSVRAHAIPTVVAILLSGAPAWAAPAPSLAMAVERILRALTLAHTSFGIEVYDLDGKRVVFARNAEKFFKPASTTKTLTEGTTLALLGGDFRFATPVYRTGAIGADGTLNGDLVLVASGDPNLSQRIRPDGTMAFENEDHSYDGSKNTKAVPGDSLAVLRDLAKQISAAGVKRVTGRVIVDASLFPEPGPEDGTGAYVSPIVVNDNLIDSIVTPATRVGEAPTIASSPQTPYVTFVDKATTGAAKSENTLDTTDVAEDNGNHTVTLVGSVPLGDPPTLYAYRVPTPARFAEVGLTLALQQAGVQIADAPRDATFDRNAFVATYLPANIVAQHVSLPLREDVRITLKVSDNLHASIMPYLWGVLVAHATAKNALQAGFDKEREFITGAGLDIDQASQTDGLGGGDAYFTPDFMAHYLAWAQTQKWYPDFYRGLPILGVDGTLFDIQTNAPAKGKVHAKTGTWGGGNALSHGGIITAKGLVGYVTTRSGKHVAFALYLNNMLAAHNQDGGHIAGQVLGALANAIYLYAK
ncbi:MAG: D-alanyl-D-alanine carboxypeptidase/D-alanyl-D-alanine-endopeptidase [Candidatus Eremiobacteraeota bacterium]|nr:D-alanyl-D-alanine carboxypeptidase/D-alanyl-D-alanine-endopeptidase [Candidatus Eremiobacteraeota bacterium]